MKQPTYIYEVCFAYYATGEEVRLKTYLNKECALKEVEKLNSNIEYGNPYYLKETKVEEC
jgi:hypothetical protein